MRGDRVEVLVDTGGGVRSFDVVATRDGRRVEVTTSRTMIEVAEVTRTGQTVRTARFLASRVIAVVEHPAADNRRKPGEPAAGRSAASAPAPGLGPSRGSGSGSSLGASFSGGSGSGFSLGSSPSPSRGPGAGRGPGRGDGEVAG